MLGYSPTPEFIRNHFEEFVNKKNVQIGIVNFAPDFVDHGADVPPGLPPGPEGAIQYVSEELKRFPDLHVQIEDMIAEDDKCRVYVRNGEDVPVLLGRVYEARAFRWRGVRRQRKALSTIGF
jgi:hypothetical protein